MDAMFERVVEVGLLLLGAYVAAGLAFAVAFVSAGVTRIDAEARGAGLGFRLLILPGSVAFWPLLLRRWLAGRQPPLESNAHRRAAEQGR